MKVINNGVSKDIEILKHFKINEDEYIIYNDSSIIKIGLLSNNERTKILIPPSDKIGELKKVIGILINGINTDLENENCTILNNSLNIENIEEISAQQIKLSENQIGNLKGNKVNTVANKTSKKNTKAPIFIIVFVIVILSFIGIAFKDKIFESLPHDSKTKEKIKKKNLIKEQKEKVDKTVVPATDLLNNISIAKVEGSLELYLLSFHKVQEKEIKSEYTDKKLKQDVEAMKNEFGKVTKIDNFVQQEIKQDDNILNEINTYLSRYGKIKVTDCYTMEGNSVITGELKTEIVDNAFDGIYYCKFSDDSWRLFKK